MRSFSANLTPALGRQFNRPTALVPAETQLFAVAIGRRDVIEAFVSTSSAVSPPTATSSDVSMSRTSWINASPSCDTISIAPKSTAGSLSMSYAYYSGLTYEFLWMPSTQSTYDLVLVLRQIA